MPSLETSKHSGHPNGPAIVVDMDAVAPVPPFAHRKPDLRLGTTQSWSDSGTDSAYVINDDRNLSAVADLASRTARVSTASETVEASDMTSVLTIVSALLLLRDGRTPIHAGGVVDPESSGAWLLLGDSHSGKSTTTANLVKAGWSYLSDDYVVMSMRDGSIDVEGWPEDFHVDEGWSRGESTGVRGNLRESSLRAGARSESATLAGLIFTRIAAEEPTILELIDAPAALERLIRQTPWLMADPKSAPALLDLLGAAASLPSGELRLGMDTYADPRRLSTIITSFAGQHSREPAPRSD